MTITIVRDKITKGELQQLAAETYVEMVKAVADVKRGLIAVGGELHADAEAVLVEDGSASQDLWGFNIYFRDALVPSLEYSSLINIRPRQNNPSILIKDDTVRKAVLATAEKLIAWEG
jgi:hypothetical protein